MRTRVRIIYNRFKPWFALYSVRMSQLGGLILFGIVITIVIILIITLLYCGCFFLCKRREPLASVENQV